MRAETTRPAGMTLKRAFQFIMAVFIVSTLAICSLSLYAGHVTRQAFVHQSRLLNQYHRAFDLSTATEQLLYTSADLSNSLSDSSLQAFQASQRALQALTQRLEDKDLAAFVQNSITQIRDGSLAAMDAYIMDDRKTGDAYMAKVRALSQALQKRVLANQSARLAELEAVKKKATRVHKVLVGTSAVLALVSIPISLALFVLIFRLVFRPVQEIVHCLRKAADNLGNSQHIRVQSRYSGEMGSAARALNRLLDATEDALQKARAHAREAEQSEARWKMILNASPDPIMLLDPQTTRIVNCNPAARSLFGMSEEDILQHSAYDFHAHELEALEAFLDGIKSENMARSDALSCGLQGRRVPVSVIGVRIRDEGLDSIMVCIRDLTEIMEKNRALEEARKEAEQASEAKSAFLATMSHEIRTPLNGMLGMAQALQYSPLAADDADKVKTIVESGEMLLTILNDVLDISKIASGKLELSCVEGDLGKVLRQACKLFEQQARDKGLDFELDIAPDLPQHLLFDPVRVRQCLNNLISNAVKFTQQGKVAVKAAACGAEGASRLVRISVSDTGIGMDAQTCERVFSSFVQADNTISREFGGTGLGLAITHELAQLMDGDVTVDSTPGKGSVFHFTFKARVPDTRPQGMPGARPAKTSLTGRRVLVVDDSDTNRKVIRTLLSATGIAISEAVNGQEALDLLEAETFDLVLLDMHMPVLSGPETMVRIRASDKPWRNIPVIAVTADHSIGEPETCKAMGLNGFVGKPVCQRQLFMSVFKCINRRAKARSLDRRAS